MGLAKTADFERPLWPAATSGETLELFAPLPKLLRSGGDCRLMPVHGSSLDMYGCAAVPQSGVIEYASSTATTISNQGYERADAARLDLLRSALSRDLPDAFDARIECMRSELLGLLGLEPFTTDVVFAPSGTDAALHAGFLAAKSLGGAFTNILVGEAETGSRMPFAVAGRHFAARTAFGADVAKGEAIDGFCSSQGHINIALRDDAGNPLALAEVDARTVGAVEKATKGGQRVLLHAMDCSKTGLCGPSVACLDFISQRWSSQVLVLVDACQLRCGTSTLRSYLARGFMVLITGSKFFTGPPFSGAVLVPGAVSGRFDQSTEVPHGLSQYTGRSSWPSAWRDIRSGLSRSINFGEWLRWEAALEEMRAYFSVPAPFRASSLKSFAEHVSKRIQAIQVFEAVTGRSQYGYSENDEMDVQTIFPFLAGGSAALSPQGARRVCRSLTEVTDRPRNATENVRGFHIGQPVGLSVRGLQVGVLRVSASARLISQSWIAGDPSASKRRLDKELAMIGAALEATAWHVTRAHGD